MNERIVVALRTSKGRLLPVNKVGRSGITLRNESDAWPRGMVLEIDADNAVTAHRLDRVRMLKGWGSREFHLSSFARDGRLGFEGVDPWSLPSGRYSLRLRIGDLETVGRYRVTVDEGEVSEVDVAAEEDTRTVNLTVPLDQFDAEILRVLTDGSSRADGMALADWLSSVDTGARRKACLLNVLALMRVHPTLQRPYLTHVHHVFWADVDRVYAQVDAALFDQLQALAKDPSKPVYYEGAPTSATHLRILEILKVRGTDVAGYVLQSFRQEGKDSLQMTVAVPSSSSKRFFADIDVDLGNPLQDVVGMVIHLGELVDPGKTDHLALRKKLAGGRARDFLYYNVQRA